MKILEKKEVKNAGWLIGGKIAQMILSLFVGVISARYLGPSNYGLITYGNTLVNFFMSLCTLGINSIIVKEFYDHSNREGEILGTAIFLRLISSCIASILIIGISWFLDRGEFETRIVVLLCSISLIFHAFDTFNYWFQAKYKSQIIAIAGFIAYASTAFYRIVLLMLEKNLYWFAFANSVDFIVLSIVLLAAYKKYNGPKLIVSINKGKQMLQKSYHYILSGMMVAIYGQTDKLMLKHMLDEEAVAFYSIATTVCAMWTFVLKAIIDAMYPTIIKAFSKDSNYFENKNRQLYVVVFYLSVVVSVFFLIFGDIVIKILYGESYMAAATPLKIITWYTAFSYLGVARNAWIVCNNKQRYLKYIYLSAAIINVLLNLVFIPAMGASGAAIASLLTQISTSIILPTCFRELRPNARIMIEAIILKNIRKKCEENV